MKRTLANDAAAIRPDDEILSAANLSPESASAIAAPLARTAMLKVLRDGDGGQAALQWGLELQERTMQDTALRAVLAEAGLFYGILQPLKLAAGATDTVQRDAAMDLAVSLITEQLDGREFTSKELEALRVMAGESDGGLKAALIRKNAFWIMEQIE